VAVKKIDATLRKSSLTLGNMVKHKLYVKQGADVAQVRRKFHEVATRLAPELKAQPSAETLVIVEGLATNEMQFEASVIAARSK
jgi:enamine deaminase RidA (YjgF/YER057c/UK114 family)